MDTINPSSASIPAIPDWLAIVREKVESLRFGVVQLVVHDGKVTQIERTEKTRLPAPSGLRAE
ncbi:MAG: YezD family protein [Verrucomicrobia bacterium]|nr:YezD family protein [Verrucomicrobiota bacterium]